MKKTVAIFSALMLAGFSQTAAFAVEPALTGEVVAEVPHELPAPSVAVNDDGVSLVAWLGQDPDVTDADPDTGGDQVCDVDANYCDIVYALVDSDGTVLTEPDAISPANVSYYFAAPYVYWNAAEGEWLVLMTNYDETALEDQGVWGQRIDADGSLIGDSVELPATSVTPWDDRAAGAIVDISSDFDDPVLVQTVWSSADNAYFVTWYAESNSLGEVYGPDGAGGEAMFGVFLNQDLSVVDGVDASFLVSQNVDSNCCVVSLGYSNERNEWILGWLDSSNDFVIATVSDSESPVVSDVQTVVDRAAYTNATSRVIGGGLAWNEDEQAWFATFGFEADNLNDGTQGLFGRWISGDTFELSDFQVIDDGHETFIDAQNADAEVDMAANYVYRQDVAVDPATGYLHIVYHKDFRNTPDSQDEDTNGNEYAILSFYTVYDPVSEEVISQNVMTPEWPSDSSRPQIDLACGGMAIVYQDWPNGDWEDPSYVRIVTEEGPGCLASTGVDSSKVTGASLAAALTVLAGAGVYALRRRVRD